MERTCTLSGQSIPEEQGITWSTLRPPIKAFLQDLKPDWADSDFISYAAYRKAVQEYTATLAAEEIAARKLFVKDSEAFNEDGSLEKQLKESLPLTFGQRLADRIAAFGGSWPFIIIFFSFLTVWMLLNTLLLRSRAFDNYPYILLNLLLSCLAAMQAPVIMMSQNRQGEKDREQAAYDYEVNRKAEAEIRLLHDKLDHLLLHQHQHLLEVLDLQLEMLQHSQGIKSTET